MLDAVRCVRGRGRHGNGPVLGESDSAPARAMHLRACRGRAGRESRELRSGGCQTVSSGALSIIIFKVPRGLAVGAGRATKYLRAMVCAVPLARLAVPLPPALCSSWLSGASGRAMAEAQATASLARLAHGSARDRPFWKRTLAPAPSAWSLLPRRRQLQASPGRAHSSVRAGFGLISCSKEEEQARLRVVP